MNYYDKYYRKPNPKTDKLIKMIAHLMFVGMVVIGTLILEISLMFHFNLHEIIFQNWIDSGSTIPLFIFWPGYMVIPCAAGITALINPKWFTKLGRPGHMV